ncbi:MAG: YraN family protein [Halodesulfovibrio sp.]|uniref:YraN family protein n=1 Tax=Halodesulfovibrio sp. TaxID=1912772 RepID=UPI00359E95EC
MVARHLETGTAGEDAATAHLVAQGYSIVVRNWRAKQLELDIVCTKGDYVIFAEVKTRSCSGMSPAINALSMPKMKRLCKAAQLYISQNNLWDTPCRFDLLAVTRTDTEYQVEHIQDAFELSQLMGGGNTAWQPW